MNPLDLTTLNHPTFIFIRPTDERLNRSVAWIAECRRCHKQQLVGAHQVKSGHHTRCLYCDINPETQKRAIPQ
jgi:siroheme synthase (precorrin-2 oxidase/ferrochelatase)